MPVSIFILDPTEEAALGFCVTGFSVSSFLSAFYLSKMLSVHSIVLNPLE